jgi:molecular chaperone IbpA
VQDNVLIVVGRANEPAQGAEPQYIHRGIAKRAFERRFQLADTIKVTGAGYDNGLLNIDLVREIPEHKKPRRIDIGGEQKGAVLEGRAEERDAA